MDNTIRLSTLTASDLKDAIDEAKESDRYDQFDRIDQIVSSSEFEITVNNREYPFEDVVRHTERVGIRLIKEIASSKDIQSICISAQYYEKSYEDGIQYEATGAYWAVEIDCKS